MFISLTASAIMPIHIAVDHRGKQEAQIISDIETRLTKYRYEIMSDLELDVLALTQIVKVLRAEVAELKAAR